MAYDAAGRVHSCCRGFHGVESGRGSRSEGHLHGNDGTSPEFIEALPAGREACLKEDGFWPGLRAGKDLRVVEITGYWSDIGTPVAM